MSVSQQGSRPLFDWAAKLYTFSFIGGMVLFFTGAFSLYTFNFFLIKFFNSNIGWIDPLVQYLFVTASLMGAALAVKSGENIKLELLVHLAQKKSALILKNSAAALVSGVFFYIYFIHCISEFQAGIIESAIGVPTWILDIPYLYIFAVSIFYFVLNAVDVLRKKGELPQAQGEQQ